MNEPSMEVQVQGTITPTPPVQKPSIGRIVHYTPNNIEKCVCGKCVTSMVHSDRSEPYPAIITKVFPGHDGLGEQHPLKDLVNLTVFGDATDGSPKPFQMAVPYDAAGAPGTWKWPR